MEKGALKTSPSQSKTCPQGPTLQKVIFFFSLERPGDKHPPIRTSRSLGLHGHLGMKGLLGYMLKALETVGATFDTQGQPS